MADEEFAIVREMIGRRTITDWQIAQKIEVLEHITMPAPSDWADKRDRLLFASIKDDVVALGGVVMKQDFDKFAVERHLVTLNGLAKALEMMAESPSLQAPEQEVIGGMADAIEASSMPCGGSCSVKTFPAWRPRGMPVGRLTFATTETTEPRPDPPGLFLFETVEPAGLSDVHGRWVGHFLTGAIHEQVVGFLGRSGDHLAWLISRFRTERDYRTFA